MGKKTEERSMADALAGSADVLAFLEEGEPKKSSRSIQPTATGKRSKLPAPKIKKGGRSKQIRMTFRLPLEIANGLIDVSAQRKKLRVKGWSQQDIAAEALSDWLRKHRSKEGYQS